MPALLARMLLVMLCAQSAIGVTNDIFDRELDAAAKPWKPLAVGLVSRRAARSLALRAASRPPPRSRATLGAAGFVAGDARAGVRARVRRRG